MENDLLSQVIHAMEGEEVYTDGIISSPSGPGTRERRSWGIERWVKRATQTGIIKAVELLALIDYHLFFANTEVDESAAIDHWGAVIRDAAVTGKLTPLNPQSYLPVTTVPEGWDWMIKVSDADHLLEEMGFDFSCATHLQHYKEEVFPTASPLQPNLEAPPQACKMPDVQGYDTPNELIVLFEAIGEFWLDVDRAKPPKQDEIIAWIRKRVDSDIKAKSIDALIRPVWARVGGNKKKSKG